jgi:hypothetical protein
MKITKIDKFFLILWFCIILFVLVFQIKNNIETGKTKYVVVKFHNNKSIYPLNKNKTIYLKQNKIKIEILNNRVRIIDSDCIEKICVNTGYIKNENQIIVCLPNKLYIKIINKSLENNTVDAVTK